jgi:Kdo2-lipid IVA lauroyltransferase/acyltransferase
MSNLALAFPEVDAAERGRIFKDSVRALGENFHDTLATPKLLLQAGMVREEQQPGQGSLQQELRLLQESGHGVLILTGHVGCWELLGGWLSSQVGEAGLGQLAVVTGSVHNAPVDDLIQKRRRDLGMKVLPRSAGAAPLLRHVQSGAVAAVLLDQNTRVENQMVPFFGQQAPTPVGFGRIAQRYKVPVLPVTLARIGGRHEVRRGQPWIWSGAGENPEEDLRDFLVWCNENLESFIRRNPAEWVWFHKRWSGGNNSTP